jgi:two-component system NtrC family sensor kinase
MVNFFEAGRKRSWLFAIAAAMIAMGLRAPLTLWLESRAPFIFAFPAIAMVGFVCGAGPALLTTLLCALWSVIPWIHPHLQGAEGLLNLALFLVSAGITAVFAGRVRIQTLRPEEAQLVEGGPALVRWLRVSMAAAALLPTAFFVFAAWYSYRQASEDAYLRIDRAVRIAQEHASKVFEANELIMGRVEDALGTADETAIAGNEKPLHEHLRRIVAGIPQLQTVWVLDAEGRPLVSSRQYPAPRATSAADRAYFQWHRDGHPGVFVTEPLMGRISDENFFNVTRARRTADGGFAGVIAVSLYPHYFTAFYQKLAKSEPGLQIALFRTDGSVITRWPQEPSQPVARSVSARIAAGHTEGIVRIQRSSQDEARILSFRQILPYPLYVRASISNKVVLAGWYRYLTVLAAFTFPTALGLVYMAWLALGRAQREFTAVQRFKHEALQRSLAEDALRQSQKLEAVGRMTGGVAHDVNNLLMVLNNNLHIMKKRIPAVAESPQTASMARAISSGEQLMRQLLAFSRRQPLRPEVIRPEGRIPAITELVRTAMGSRIRVRTAVDTDLPPIKLDIAELELAVLNLAVNAKDAMPDGGELEIRLTRATGTDASRLGKDGVVLALSDTGHGIPAEILDRVMEPFFTTKPEGRGTGLGLSQVYGLCAQSGGFARVASEENKGTTVAMVFPACAELPTEPEAAALQDDSPLDLRIMLVEDNIDVANATQPVLESLGCTVLHVTSAGAAMAAMASQPDAFDVVLSDIVMPGGISGLELAQLFKVRYPTIPVILLTGYAAEVQSAEQLSHMVMMKPCTGASLADAMRKATARRPRRAAGSDGSGAESGR